MKAASLQVPTGRARVTPDERPVADLPLPQHPRYGALDLWRGLACLSVVVFHSAANLVNDRAEHSATVEALRLMWVGVPLFFVISGYCIAATCDSSRRKPHAVGQYFKRRFRRIYPPYWALLGMGVLLNALVFGTGWVDHCEAASLVNPASLTIPQWLGNLTLTEGVRFHFLADPYQMFMGHAWTLAYEEQFYLVCGLLLLCCPRRFFTGVAVVTLLTGCLAPLTFKKVGIYTFGFFFDGRWLVFAAGVLVYYGVNYASRAVFVMINLALAGGAAASVWLCGYLRHRQAAGSLGHDEVQLGIEFVVGAIFALLLSLTHQWDHRITTWWPLRPFFVCGTMCYSIYLVHLPITHLSNTILSQAGLSGFWPTVGVAIPLGIAASVAGGYMFHACVEKHFLNPPSHSPVTPGDRVEPPDSARLLPAFAANAIP